MSEDILQKTPSQGLDNTTESEAPSKDSKAKEESKNDVLDKKVVYKSSMLNFYFASCIVIVLAVLLIRTGIQMTSGRGGIIDTDVIIFSAIPILLAVVGLLVVIISFFRFRNRTITLTPIYLIYDNGRSEPVNMAWTEFQTATETKQTKSIFDYTVISNGLDSFFIERFFFPKYDKLCADIKTVQRLAKKQDIFI